MNAERFMSAASLHAHSCGRIMAEVMAAALRAVDPRAAVRGAVRVAGDEVVVGERRVALSARSRLFVVGAGKAGAPMTEAIVEVFGDRISTGAVVVKEGHLTPIGARIGRIDLLEAGHPIPDERGAAAAAAIAALLEETTEDDVVIVAISGGGSALLTLPAPGLALTDVRALIGALLRCGATINEINCLRKHCVRLAGGELARLASPAATIALIVSDVVGSPLDVIASGPTVPDPTTFADAWNIIRRYDLEGVIPATLAHHFRRGRAGEIPETPKPGEALWGRVYNHVVAGNTTAAEAAVAAARERGFEARLLTTFLEGEAREVGRVAASIAREHARVRRRGDRPTLIVAGGETTVTLRGDGRGGRNQELALGAVEGLAGVEGTLVATLATDGGDGPTDAAGAVVSGETLARARALDLNPHDFLRRNDSYRFFARLGDLLRPGPTLTNVNDLLFIIVADDIR